LQIYSTTVIAVVAVVAAHAPTAQRNVKMKITKSQLKQIIKEELEKAVKLKEYGDSDPDPMGEYTGETREAYWERKKCEQLLKDYKLAKQVYGDEYRREGGGGMDILQQYEKIMDDAMARGLKNECPWALSHQKLNAPEEEGDLTELKTLLKAKVES